MPARISSKSVLLNSKVGAVPSQRTGWPKKFLDNGRKDRYVHLNGGLHHIDALSQTPRFFFSYHFAWGSTHGLSAEFYKRVHFG